MFLQNKDHKGKIENKNNLLEARSMPTFMIDANTKISLKNEINLLGKTDQCKAWIFGRERKEKNELIAILEQEHWPIISIQTIDYFESIVDKVSPDILILCSDIMGSIGNKLISDLRQNGKMFPIICIGSKLQADQCVAALEDGANDYIKIPIDKNELLSRIKKAIKTTKKEIFQPQATSASPDYTICNVEFNPIAKNLTNKAGQQIPLTKGEVKMLILLCKLKGETVTREKLGVLTETESNKSRTIDVRISRIKKKLMVLDPEETYITTNRLKGYRITSNIQEHMY